MFQLYFGVLLVALNSCSAGVVPSAVAIPRLVSAPAAIAYSKAVPYDVPPHVSRIDINSKTISAPWVTAATSVFAASPFAVTAPATVAAQQIIAPPAAISTHPIIAALPTVAGAHPVPAAPIISGTGFIQPPYTSPFGYPTFATYDPTIFG